MFHKVATFGSVTYGCMSPLSRMKAVERRVWVQSMGAAKRYVYRRRFDFLAAFVSAVMAGQGPAGAEGSSDRLQRGNHFAAAHDSVAFPVVGPQDRLVLLVADLQSKRLQRIGI